MGSWLLGRLRHSPGDGPSPRLSFRNMINRTASRAGIPRGSDTGQHEPDVAPLGLILVDPGQGLGKGIMLEPMTSCLTCIPTCAPRPGAFERATLVFPCAVQLPRP